jgi:hypothetical protein
MQNLVTAIYDAVEQRATKAARMTHSIGPSLFRLLAGVAILSEYLLVYGQRRSLFGNEGVVPYAEFLQWTVPLSIYQFTPTHFTFEVAYHASVLVAILWTVGVWTRWLTPCLMVCWTSLMDRGPGIWDGGDNLIAILLIYACFMDVGAHFTLQGTPTKMLSGRASALTVLHNTALAACSVQVCIVYFVAGLAKARGHTWLDGSALYNSMADLEFGWPGVRELLYNNGLVLSIAGPLTVFFQISFPFFFYLNRKSRLAILAVAICFHLGIGIFMGLVSFAAHFIAAELALISDHEYRTLGRWFYAISRALHPTSMERRPSTASLHRTSQEVSS